MERECKRYDEKWRDRIMFENKKTAVLNYNNKNEALEILKRFTKKYLHGKIDELADFSFWDILTDTEFNGGPLKGDTFDGDRTRIVYAIDKLLYDEKGIPDFNLGKNYTGDTINTFRTLFGNRFTGSEQNFEKDFLNNDKTRIELKNKFFRAYQQIGNFFILPNSTIKNGEKNESLNTYRGTNREYKDYFDVFLNNLYTEKDKTIAALKQEGTNKVFFNVFSAIEKFRELFYLEEYVNLNFNHPKTKNNSKCNLRYFNALGIDKSKYLDFAFAYIEKATELINKRSVKIVEELKSKYRELTQ